MSITTAARALSPADDAAHAAASHVRPDRTVLKAFPAGHPRGSWPAEEFAASQRAKGRPVKVVMDIDSDKFLVVTSAVAS